MNNLEIIFDYFTLKIIKYIKLFLKKFQSLMRIQDQLSL